MIASSTELDLAQARTAKSDWEIVDELCVRDEYFSLRRFVEREFPEETSAVASFNSDPERRLPDHISLRLRGHLSGASLRNQ